MTCYIHNISPIKKASSLNRKFFNCTIQAKDNVIRALCFSPEKHSQFSTIEATKSPVKLQDFSYLRNNQSEDLVIHKMTTATPISATEILFPITEELQKNAPITIASLQKLAPEQLVDLKAEVCAVSATKKSFYQGKDPLRKQEVVLRDQNRKVSKHSKIRRVQSRPVNSV